MILYFILGSNVKKDGVKIREINLETQKQFKYHYVSRTDKRILLNLSKVQQKENAPHH